MGQKMTQEQLLELFHAVDIDRSGTISLDEYFLFALSIGEAQTGTGVEAVFRQYDKNGEGVLDVAEFSRAVEDMGFGPKAHEIFLQVQPLSTSALLFHWVVRRLSLTRPSATAVGYG